MSFDEAQIAKVSRSYKAQPAEPGYDATLDDEVADMFGRRHDELESFTPSASRAYHALVYGAILGGGPESPTDVPLLNSIALNTRHPMLRKYACSSLRVYLRDRSVFDVSLKSQVRQALESIGEPL